MRSPSSLIFLALIGVWAAYFVQYWIRRRDHLATARSVEQFSAAMRVLERRPPIPRTDLSDPAPRSWSVHPARTARPQVVVKRAAPSDVPAVTAGRPLPGSVPAHHASQPAARRVRPARRVRALVLLAGLVGTLVAAGLVGPTALPAWTPVVGLAVVVGSFLWVRSAVRAEQAARVAARRRAATHARRRASAPAPTARPVPSAPRAAAPRGAVGETTDAAVAAGSVEETPAAPVVRGGSDPLEVALAVDAPAATPSTDEAPRTTEPAVVTGVVVAPEPVLEYVHLVDEDDIPLTWDPVPVPRPTYTMKAKAERPEVPPAEVTPDPVRSELPVRAEVDERRAAGA